MSEMEVLHRDFNTHTGGDEVTLYLLKNVEVLHHRDRLARV